MIPVEEGDQYLGAGSADDRVSTWVGRICRSVASLRKPIRVGFRLWVLGCVGSSYRGHWTPKIVCVFRIVEGDRRITEAQIEQGKQPGASSGGQLMAHRRRLRDLVPVILNRSRPEAAGQRLVLGSEGAVDDSQ